MISFILSYREVDQYRKRNLLFTIEDILSLKIEKEIILVEEGLENHVSNIPNVRPIFIHSNTLFNKSKCYNAGAKIAKYDILCFRDIDLFIDSFLYYHSINLLKEYDVVDPYNEVRYLSDKDSDIFIRTHKMNKPIRTIESRVTSGGMFLQHRNKFLGFDEKCVGYGYEDDLYDIKLYKNKQKVCKIMNGISYHFWHPVREAPQHKNLDLYRNQRTILWQIKWITELKY